MYPISPLSERVAILALLAVLSAGGGYLVFTGHDVPDWYAGLIGLLASWLLGVRATVKPSGSGLSGGAEVGTPPAQPSAPPPATGASDEPHSGLTVAQVARDQRAYARGRPPFDPRQN